MAIGVDIEDIERFKGKSQEFVERVFTPVEIEYCNKFSNPEGHFAVRFCAKEAVIKALSSVGITGLVISDIEVYNDESKCPHVRILKKLDKNFKFELSLSHDRSKAVAFVTVQEL